jgi:hypothetical protein
MAGNVPPFRGERLVRSETSRFNAFDARPFPRPSSPWHTAQLFRKMVVPSTGRIGGSRWGVVCAEAGMTTESNKTNVGTRRCAVALPQTNT